MIEVLKKIWRFAGEEQKNIRKSMIGGFFYFGWYRNRHGAN